MANESIQQLPYPAPGDPPDVPNDMRLLAEAVAPLTNMVFADVPARDAALPSPVEGMEAFTGSGSSAVKWIYVNGDWRVAATSTTTAITRTILTGADVVDVTNGSLTTAQAIIDEDELGNRLISWWFVAGGGSYPGSGSVTNTIGYLEPALRPAVWSNVDFSSGSGGLRGLADVSGASGEIRVRWQESTTSGSTPYFQATYVVLAI